MPEWLQHTSEGLATVVPVEDFLGRYMAGRAPPPQTISSMQKVSERAFQKLVNACNNSSVEKDFNQPMAHYLDTLCRRLGKRPPNFADKSQKKFDRLVSTDHDSKPDVVGSNWDFDEQTDVWRWIVVATVFELKFRVDIFKDDRVPTDMQQRDNLLQLLHNPRRYLMATLACFAFTVSVFGRNARLIRVDRTGFIASQAFDWIKDKHVFPEFLWRLYNAAGPRTVLGHDPTISQPTKEEKTMMFPALLRAIRRSDPPPRVAAFSQQPEYKELNNSRWMIVKINGVDQRYLSVGRPIHHSSGLFSRGTRVDRVLLEIERDSEDSQFYILKDAWQQNSRLPEFLFYKLIELHAERTRRTPPGLAVLAGHYEFAADGDPASCHQTITARLQDESTDRERSHQRTLTRSFGQRLDRLIENVFAKPPMPGITCFREATEAVLDAIIGHKFAYEAGVLHRDPSLGNVLATISDDGGGNDDARVLQEGVDGSTSSVRRVVGFLHDFDMSALTTEGIERFKERFPERDQSTLSLKSLDVTGTFVFLAIDLLRARARGISIEHKAKHDLEAFIYILVHLASRYTVHTDPQRDAAAARLFDHQDPNAASDAKAAWVDARCEAHAQNQPFVPGNAPLSTLIYRLCALVAEGYELGRNPSRGPATELTHDVVINVFQEALAQSWPIDDLVPYKAPILARLRAQSPPANSRSSTHGLVVPQSTQSLDGIGRQVPSRAPPVYGNKTATVNDDPDSKRTALDVSPTAPNALVTVDLDSGAKAEEAEAAEEAKLLAQLTALRLRRTAREEGTGKGTAAD